MDYYNFDDENQIVNDIDYVDIDTFAAVDYNQDDVEWSSDDFAILSFDN